MVRLWTYGDRCRPIEKLELITNPSAYDLSEMMAACILPVGSDEEITLLERLKSGESVESVWQWIRENCYEK